MHGPMNIKQKYYSGREAKWSPRTWKKYSICSSQSLQSTVIPSPSLMWCISQELMSMKNAYNTHIRQTRLWSFCFTVWKLQDMHKTSTTSNRRLHVSKHSIWIAHSLPEYENFINCDQSTEVKDNCLHQVISKHKNMHTHTHTRETDKDRISQWILK
jgi:hypothetical protein